MLFQCTITCNCCLLIALSHLKILKNTNVKSLSIFNINDLLTNRRRHWEYEDDEDAVDSHTEGSFCKNEHTTTTLLDFELPSPPVSFDSGAAQVRAELWRNQQHQTFPNVPSNSFPLVIVTDIFYDVAEHREKYLFAMKHKHWRRTGHKKRKKKILKYEMDGSVERRTKEEKNIKSKVFPYESPALGSLLPFLVHSIPTFHSVDGFSLSLIRSSPRQSAEILSQKLSREVEIFLTHFFTNIHVGYCGSLCSIVSWDLQSFQNPWIDDRIGVCVAKAMTFARLQCFRNIQKTIIVMAGTTYKILWDHRLISCFVFSTNIIEIAMMTIIWIFGSYHHGARA